MIGLFLLIGGIFYFRSEAKKRGTSSVPWIWLAIFSTVAPFIIIYIISFLLSVSVVLSEANATTIGMLFTFVQLAGTIGMLFYFYDLLKKKHPLSAKEDNLETKI